MAIMPAGPQSRGSAARTRRAVRPAYVVRLNRPFRHDEDADLIEGVYTDNEGMRMGVVVFAGDGSGLLDTLLVIPGDRVAPVHAEASLDADHRVETYEQVAALVYAPEENPPPGVVELGEAWDAGDVVIYTFESEDDARSAQAQRAWK